MLKPFALPENLLMGSATASLQIEGGDTNNSWYAWAERGGIADGSKTSPAADHWNRVGQDVALMKELKHQVYRMSLEWSRIEPEAGRFSADALAHYRGEIEKLIKAGIKPLVTLHHFSNPLWFENSGGWLRDDAPSVFQAYARAVTEALGDLVSDWVTINEPNVYLTNGYVYGVWPPGRTSPKDMFAAAANMIDAHILAYGTIHDVRSGMGRTDTMAGAAHHLRVFDPASGNPLDTLVAKLFEYLFQGLFLDGMLDGSRRLPLRRHRAALPGRASDFLGINYYTRDLVSFTPSARTQFGRLSVKPGSPVNDLGWEIYPEGLYRLVRKYHRRYGLPVYITENGIADRADAQRSRYLYDHLYQLRRLADEGVDLRCYCHWTTMDNFEWMEGFTARFGLVELDPATQKRTVRKSGRFFAEIAAARAVTQDMIRNYLG